ncbi:MAG: MFS transporter [Solirubrobacteraceae bacterium]
MSSESNAGAERGGGFRESFRWDVIRSTPGYAYLVAGVAAVGGMLFGYDIGVISGAENLLKAQFHLSAGSEEVAVSAVLMGAIIGGLIAGRLSDAISRRYSLLGLAIVYAIGAVATALAPTLFLFVVFRIIVGIAVGASSMIVPTYIAEMAPKQIRGGLVILQQLAISGGIFLSYVLDYIFFSAGWGWRPMFAAAVIPGIALAVGMAYMSHTPRWLGMQGRWDDAERVMERITSGSAEEEMQGLRDDLEQTDRASFRELLAPGMRGALIAGIGLAILQQFVGPNTVLFYGPTIFGYAGISAGSGGLLAEICVGAVLFIFVLPTIALVDVVGRKALLLRTDRYGEHARAPGNRVRVRRGKLGTRRARHPARVHRLLLAEHLPTVLADDRRAVPQPVARIRSQRGDGGQLVGQPAHHPHLPDRRQRARQGCRVLDLRRLRGCRHRLRPLLRPRDQGSPAGGHRRVLDSGSALAAALPCPGRITHRGGLTVVYRPPARW